MRMWIGTHGQRSVYYVCNVPWAGCGATTVQLKAKQFAYNGMGSG